MSALQLGLALNLGHLGHGLRLPNIERPPNMGAVIFFLILIKEKKIELVVHFFPLLRMIKILELC